MSHSFDCTVGGCDTRDVCCGIRSDLTSNDAARGSVAQAHRRGHSSRDKEMIGRTSTSMPGAKRRVNPTARPNADQLHHEAGDQAINHQQAPPPSITESIVYRSHCTSPSRNRARAKGAASPAVPHRDTRPDPTRSSHPPFQTSPEPAPSAPETLSLPKPPNPTPSGADRTRDPASKQQRTGSTMNS